MLINPSSFVFSTTLVLGTMISISSSSWLGMWMGLEMNLLSFVPLINKGKSPYETESAMKYFLVQAMASILFLIAVLSNEVYINMTENTSYYLISSALLMKMGAAPFHFWFPGVMEGIDWMGCFILMTWQKLAPFVLISYKMMNNLIMSVIFMSTLIGSVGGLNQNSMRKIMAYSSISHLGWMLSAMMISNNLWTTYFIIYSLLNMAVIYLFYSQSMYQLSQSYFIKNNPLMKFSMMISMLSLAGLPPFLGFLPKWLVIQNLVSQSYFIMLTFMVMTTLMTLYFYMRVMFSAFMFMSQESKWMSTKTSNEFISMILILSIIGIPITTWMMIY
uniref:NADH-ubiquinone oxidoreductase chain 2 n=2 Tax=Libellulidae TaxID=6964 RepID=A0A4Y5SFC3_9ODON|nr:NADH dehydrogenase subunit 2 [Tramea virginia]QDA21693.1 NADH dehydrogenase subunit 2 [Orthetrum testaceum]QDA21706.1 NADH dehydrogenase subunit 2 [Tramea virginia]WJK72293.1 NADH dehydrogenase subunit 2 [Crocothemis servilia servilia]